jgi:signal transduction histidine kinase
MSQSALAPIEGLTRESERFAGLCNELQILTDLMRRTPNRHQISLQEVAGTAWTQIRTRDTDFSVEEDGELIADEKWVSALFQALFQNAVDHAGTAVTIRVGTTKNGDGFYIADNGVGIPTHAHEIVFQPGYTTANTGSGYGLRIVSHVVQAHDWELSLDENETGGATFTITTLA